METQPNLDPNLAAQILNNLPIAAFISDADGIVVWCNSNAAQLLNGTEQNLVNQKQSELEKNHFKTMGDENRLFVIVSDKENGVKTWLQRQDISLPDATASLYFDITQQQNAQNLARELQEKLEQLSTVDTVSGLLNRRAMLQSLEPLVSRSRRYNNPLSVISMELLNFDAIKQEHGIDGGNEAVKQLSFMLKDQMRWADIVSRTEDNRFVFVLPETDKESALHLANKINTHIAELSVSFANQTVQLQVCFGVSSWEKGNDSVLLLRHATQSLDEAKKSGPGSVQDC